MTRTNSENVYSTPPYEARLAYTILRAAELASISRSQIYIEIQAGRLTATKIGGRTVIQHDDLVAWVKSLPHKAAAGCREIRLSHLQNRKAVTGA